MQPFIQNPYWSNLVMKNLIDYPPTIDAYVVLLSRKKGISPSQWAYTFKIVFLFTLRFGLSFYDLRTLLS